MSTRSYTEREALTKIANEGVKIGDSYIIVPVDIQSQAVFVKGLMAPLKDAVAKYVVPADITLTDTFAEYTVYTPPTGYYAILWKIRLITDANTNIVYPWVDGEYVNEGVGASTTKDYDPITNYPFGIPVKSKVSVYGVAATDTTSTVKVRLWLWEVPLTPE